VIYFSVAPKTLSTILVSLFQSKPSSALPSFGEKGFLEIAQFVSFLPDFRFPDVVQRQDMYWESKNRQLSEALKQKSHTPPSSPLKPRAPRSVGRRRDSSVSSSDGEGLITPSRQLTKS